MTERLEITLKTLTPLWTGGADGKSDRLHVTGILGSLRWWYEAIVRGLGGYVSDPTAEPSAARSEFDTAAYAQAQRDKRPYAETLAAGLKTVCPVSYLFGTTGWARLFQLQAVDVPTTPLHFRTMVGMNQGWLTRIFGGESRNISDLKVPYGELRCQVALRGHDSEFARNQLALALRFAAEHAGLGAKLQHGFGQITLTLPAPMASVTVVGGLAELAERLRSSGLRASGPLTETPFDLRNFVSLTYDAPANAFAAFKTGRTHFGSEQKRNETGYLPCVFDLRYKGTGSWGMRRWLEDPHGAKHWSHVDANQLMGVSKKQGEIDNEDDRQAGRLCFGMPYRLANGTYRLRVYGFAPPGLLTPEELRDLCNEYVQHILRTQPTNVVLGKELIAQAQGGRP
jgi:CRISPR-associated protein Cmr1